MQALFATYQRLLNATSLEYKRYLYYRINWENPLIIVRGPKGIGKTTMMLQHIKETFSNPDNAFYASLDNIWFGNHTIVELIDYLYRHGTTTVFLDEVHKYPNWRQEVKNAYDSYPELKIVITGSSMLDLTTSDIGDLSRRARLYTMRGLSFREYLIFEDIMTIEPLSLDEILHNHVAIATKILQKHRVLPTFYRYLTHGYYPFYKGLGDDYYDRIQRVVDTVIESEIPAFGGISYGSVFKLRKLLAILSESSPYTLNVSALSKLLETSRDNIVKIVGLLAKAALTINLYAGEQFKALAKPVKILFDNATLMSALSENTDSGTLRETFMVSQLIESHQIFMPSTGDILVDKKYLFEVGGKKKGYNQIKDIPDSYVVADDLECGYHNKIPMWLFGLMY